MARVRIPLGWWEITLLWAGIALNALVLVICYLYAMGGHLAWPLYIFAFAASLGLGLALYRFARGLPQGMSIRGTMVYIEYGLHVTLLEACGPLAIGAVVTAVVGAFV